MPFSKFGIKIGVQGWIFFKPPIETVAAICEVNSKGVNNGSEITLSSILLSFEYVKMHELLISYIISAILKILLLSESWETHQR